MTIIIKQDSVGSFFLNRASPVKENPPHTHQYFPPIVEEGLDYILEHFEPPIWPRTISTHITRGRQVIVYSKEETLARYTQANLLDCKINAYPFRENWAIELLGQVPNFLFLDLDLTQFSSREALDKALRSTLRNINEKLNGAESTTLWSGNGYHIYLPIQAVVLELESVFEEFEQSSRQLIQWSEQFLTNNKADPRHTKSLSFKNCMLRIPGSCNSKLIQQDKGRIVSIPAEAQVRITQKWNGVRPNIKPLLSKFYIYLADAKIKEIHRQRKRLEKSKNVVSSNDSKRIIPWVEILLQTPISDYRKYVVWRILAPYLMNHRKLRYQDAANTITDWLDKCNSITRLDFNRDYYIKYNLNTVVRIGYRPVSFDKLRAENRGLYDKLSLEIRKQVIKND